MPIISAEQLFNTENGELVSCQGRKNRDSQLNQHLSDVYCSAVNISRGLQPWRTQDHTLGQVRKIWAVWLLHLTPWMLPSLRLISFRRQIRAGCYLPFVFLSVAGVSYLCERTSVALWANSTSSCMWTPLAKNRLKVDYGTHILNYCIFPVRKPSCLSKEWRIY